MPRFLSSKRAAPWLFLAPAMLFAVVFLLLPVVFAAYISLTAWDSLSPPRWMGLKNYQYLFATDPIFLKTLRQTLYFALGTMLIGVPLALALSYALSRARLQGVWRVLYTLPMVTNIVAVGFIFWFVFRQTDGLLNRLLALAGLPGPGWLTDPSLAMVSAILVYVWMELGRNMLLFMAGLGSIDESYYEAARLDGAGAWQLFRFVTLPLLKPTILFVVITGFISGHELLHPDAGAVPRHPRRAVARGADHRQLHVPDGLRGPADGPRLGGQLRPLRASSSWGRWCQIRLPARGGVRRTDAGRRAPRRRSPSSPHGRGRRRDLPRAAGGRATRLERGLKVRGPRARRAASWCCPVPRT
jgi:multiple sugar transport system permease protein